MTKAVLIPKNNKNNSLTWHGSGSFCQESDKEKELAISFMYYDTKYSLPWLSYLIDMTKALLILNYDINNYLTWHTFIQVQAAFVQVTRVDLSPCHDPGMTKDVLIHNYERKKFLIMTYLSSDQPAFFG